MPVYRVRTINQEIFENIIRADSKDEARDVGKSISGESGQTGVDYFWYDSEVNEIEEQECDND